MFIKNKSIGNYVIMNKSIANDAVKNNAIMNDVIENNCFMSLLKLRTRLNIKFIHFHFFQWNIAIDKRKR